MKLSNSKLILSTILCFTFLFSGCSNATSTIHDGEVIEENIIEYDEQDYYTDWQKEDVTYIQ